MSTMRHITSYRFFNKPHRLYHKPPLAQRLRFAHCVVVPGHRGDPTDRGQPGRFERWHKLPRAAHRLFWRTHA